MQIRCLCYGQQCGVAKGRVVTGEAYSNTQEHVFSVEDKRLKAKSEYLKWKHESLNIYYTVDKILVLVQMNIEKILICHFVSVGMSYLKTSSSDISLTYEL